jgi:hypothetical protein
MRLGMIVCRAFLAFLYFQNGSETELFYLDNIQLTYRALNIFMSTSIVIGDALIVSTLLCQCLAHPNKAEGRFIGCGLCGPRVN